MSFFKIFTFIFVLALVLILGGFAWLAFSDVKIAQTDVIKEIPYESIQNAP